MRSLEKKFSLSNDRASALELLRLQEAAQLANERLMARRSFKRNDKLSHVVYAVLNLAQFLTGFMGGIFHHFHHVIHQKRLASNPDIPKLPEQWNPIFFVYPIAASVSLLLCILWLYTELLNLKPIIALLGNGVGGILIVIVGIAAMRHAEVHINLNEVSDEELLTHPIFLHNFVLCIISVFDTILYLISVWILYDLYKWRQGHNNAEYSNKSGKKFISKPACKCKCKSSLSCRKSTPASPSQNLRSKENNANMNDSNCSFDVDPTNPNNTKTEQDGNSEPIVVYCCCVDCHRYLKASRQTDPCTHEFQVVQVM